MHTKYDGCRILIIYNFLGLNASSEMEELIEYFGFNELVDEITEYASMNKLSIDDTVDYLCDEFDDYIEGYHESLPDGSPRELQGIVAPHLEEIILLDIGKPDKKGRLKYSIYLYGGSGELSESTRMNLNGILSRIQEDISNSKLLLIMLDVFTYGEPICQIEI